MIPTINNHKFSFLSQINEVIFDIQLMTKPNDGLYEAVAKYIVSDDRFVVSAKEISRVNQYGTASHCVGQTYPHLTKYCFCKEKAAGDSESYMKVIMG